MNDDMGYKSKGNDAIKYAAYKINENPDMEAV